MRALLKIRNYIKSLYRSGIYKCHYCQEYRLSVPDKIWQEEEKDTSIYCKTKCLLCDKSSVDIIDISHVLGTKNGK